MHRGRCTVAGPRMYTFPGDEVEPHADLRLGFARGRQARIEIFREHAVDLPKWSVLGDRGTIICPDFDMVRVERPDGSVRRYTGLAPLQACDEFYDGLARALRGGGPPPVDAGDAADVVRVLEAAHASAGRGGTLVPLLPAGGP